MAQQVRVIVTSARVRVVAEDRADVDAGDAASSGPLDDLTLLAGSGAVTVRVPIGTDVMVGSASGDVTLEGELGSVRATTASGDVDAADVASIDARSLSGKLRVGRSRGTVRLRTKSAGIHVSRAEGEVRAATVSGKVRVDGAAAGVTLKTVSGRIDAVLTAPHDATVETVSGRMTVHVPRAARPNVRVRTVSGKRRVDCETGTDLTVTGRSISGSITVTAT
jgi:DUF4097 and DUF4098 domain-containing protein YvlB